MQQPWLLTWNKTNERVSSAYLVPYGMSYLVRTSWGDEDDFILMLIDSIWTDLQLFPQVSQIIVRQENLLLMNRVPFDAISFAHPRSKSVGVLPCKNTPDCIFL